jgi:hypothetical protein
VGLNGLELPQLDHPHLHHPPLEQQLDQVLVGAQLTGHDRHQLHGQIEPLLLAFLLLPKSWWPLAPFPKPQIGLEMVFYVPRRKILSTAAVTGAAWILSLLLFGSWPMALFNQLSPFVEQAHNLWLGLWPLQVPVGLLLILLGIRRADERMLVSAGPSASPYAATSSLIGPWMAGVSFLKDWEA